ncbi:hypothetical protein QYE76_045253 [Lolium multiflorum]|uniref:Transposase (putative) gypsy type domain-containing protein n=1 Tax=Lolium multiflorum TaxID=4521 RepID=A0AAD8WXH2_LOLMU|nr:hypothetical protein QYE76_045253 [Lolium multiflorum]
MAAEDLEWERSKISNQDLNLMKKLGLMKKKDVLRFPSEESYPSPPIEYRVSFVDHLIRGLSTPIHDFLRGLLFVYGLQLHQLTPNSILHVSIFITLYECFLGVHPNWALWKRIFCLRRNGSHNIAYNIGGVVICVRPDIEYFDVKFPDSVQGWRKRWLYVHEESSDSVEYNIAPFDGGAKILRRRSWDAEATEEEKTATEALMSRIHELQNTRGKELSGIQITAYFLRIRVQPLQARKNPLWMYDGEEDVDRLSKDLSVKDLEKLIRRISSLSKKDAIPSSCRVEPYSGTNALPEFLLLFLLFLKVGKSKNGLLSPTTTRVLLALRVKKKLNPRLPHRHTPFPELFLQGTREKGRKLPIPAPPKPAHLLPKKLFPMKKGQLSTLMKMPLSALVSEAQPDGDETSPPHQDTEHPTPVASPRASSPKRARVEPVKEPTLLIGGSTTPSMDDPFMKEFIRLGTHFIGYRDHAKKLEGKTQQDYDLENPEGDRLLDALSLLEIHGHEARQGLADARTGLSRLFPYFFTKKEEPETFTALAKCFSSQEDLGLGLRQEGLKVGVEGTIALVANSQQDIDWAKVGDVKKMETKRWQSLIKAAKPNSKKILAYLGCKPTPAPSSSKPEVK